MRIIYPSWEVDKVLTGLLPKDLVEGYVIKSAEIKYDKSLEIELDRIKEEGEDERKSGEI
jgi:hypothetical protein